MIIERVATTKNETNYLTYVGRLRAVGKKFPITKDGNANLSEIAIQSGFGRDRLYKNKKLSTWFKEDLKDIGIEGNRSKTTNDDFLAKKADKKSRDASVLRTELDAKIQEVDGLRNELEDLQAEIKKLKRQKSENEAAMEEMGNAAKQFKEVTPLHHTPKPLLIDMPFRA